MRTRLLCLLAVTAVGCRDLRVPESVTAGTVYGTIVYTRPGSADRFPAAGALVELIGTSVSTNANADGAFLLTNITRATGQIRISFDPDGIGKATRQKLIELKDINAGIGRQIALGEVLVSQNARLHGKVVRGDNPSVGGHSGTQVFVPEGPYTTFTNDDGSYSLRDLPEGTLRIAFFRPGYATQMIDNVTLRPSEDFSVGDVVLERDLTVQLPGSISGHVSFSPTLASALGTAVVATDNLGVPVAGSVQDDGSLSISNVTPGVYRVTVSRDGYVPASIGNVLVGSGTALVLQEIVLVAGSAPDAGIGVPTDAGTCTPGTACNPGAPCHSGATDCSTGSPVCLDIGSKLDGTPCGANQVCSVGLCQSLCGAGLSCLAVEQGEGQSAMVNRALPAPIVLLATAADGSPLADAGIAISAPPGTSCTPSSGVTDGTGHFTIAQLRMGRSVGPHVFTVTSAAVTTAALIHATATQAPDGTIYPLVNVGHQTGLGGIGGPATEAQLDSPDGVAIASDGTLYVADTGNNCVKKVTAQGVISTLAGLCATSEVPSSGNGGPAILAQLNNPRSLVLDDAANLLYFVDDATTVRQIDLVSEWIFEFAGFGAGGDNGLAKDALLGEISQLSLGREAPQRLLYIGERAPGNRIRRVDALGIITTFLANSGTNQPVELLGCGFNGGPSGACSVVFDAAGNAFISGAFGGTDWQGPTNGIVRRSPSGALTRIGGDGEGSQGAERVSVYSAMFSSPPALALDAAGNLIAMVSSSHVIWRINARTGAMTRLAGALGGIAGPTGDFDAGVLARLDDPSAISLLPANLRDLVLTDRDNMAVRIIRSAGEATLTGSGTLSPAAGGTLSMVTQVNAAAPFTAAVALTDDGGSLWYFPVSFSSVSDGGSVSAPTEVTDSSGEASVQLFAGPNLGTYVYQASFRDLAGAHIAGSPVTFSVATIAPDAGTMFPYLNKEGSGGNTGLGGAALVARSRNPTGIAVASDGTVYVAEQFSGHRIKKISPQGEITLLAGTGVQGSTGDTGPALSATLDNPTGLALDEAANKLYVADTGGNRIRVIDLGSVNKTITTVAGGGLGTPPADGDNGPGTDAILAGPTHIRLHGGSLYISDDGHYRMRRLNLGTNDIEPYLVQGTCASTVAEFASCQYGCDIAWDQGGVPYLSGEFCGTAFNGNANGVARVEADAGVTHFAGYFGAAANEWMSATATGFPVPPALAFDSSNRLHVAVSSAGAVRRIESDTSIHTIAGMYGTSGPSPNCYRPGWDCTLNGPWDIAFTPGGHLLISDTFNHTVRMVW